MTQFVLIHGAFHGGWCWRPVATWLRAAGHQVFAPSLTGLGDRAHLLSGTVDLETHIDDIVELLRVEDITDAVLVGHSYGGMAIMGAADRAADRLRAVVFLDAHVPGDGDTMLALRGGPASGAVHLLNLSDKLAAPAPDAAVFNLTGDLIGHANQRLTPHPVATMTQPIRLSGAWEAIPAKVYIRLEQYDAPYFDRNRERLENDPDWTVISRDAAHDVMLSEPDWLAETLSRWV